MSLWKSIPSTMRDDQFTAAVEEYFAKHMGDKTPFLNPEEELSLISVDDLAYTLTTTFKEASSGFQGHYSERLDKSRLVEDLTNDIFTKAGQTLDNQEIFIFETERDSEGQTKSWVVIPSRLLAAQGQTIETLPKLKNNIFAGEEEPTLEKQQNSQKSPFGLYGTMGLPGEMEVKSPTVEEWFGTAHKFTQSVQTLHI